MSSSPSVNREIRFGRKKTKAPECLEFLHSFMFLRSSLDAASADPQSWWWRKRVNRAVNCGNRRNLLFVVTQKKLLDWRRNIQIFGSLHKKKKGKEEKENCQKNCLGWTKCRQREWEHATTTGTNHGRRWNDRSKWKRSTRRGDEMPNQITGSSQNEWLESEIRPQCYIVVNQQFIA